MKLPRGVSADRLIRALERLGYQVTPLSEIALERFVTIESVVDLL